MKRSIHTTLTRFTSTLLTACALGGLPLAHAHACSNSTGAGTWAFTITGTVILPTGVAVPVAQMGIFNQDSSGDLIGIQTRSLGGGIAQETFTGTTSTNPDCTGQVTVYVYDKQSGALVRTSTLDFILIDEGKEARAIVASIVLPNGASLAPVLTVEYKRVEAAKHKSQ